MKKHETMRTLKITYTIIGFIALIILFTGISIGVYGALYNIPETDPIADFCKMIMVVGVSTGLLWVLLFFLYVIIDDY